jgi:DnaJ-class molecular chaperone
MIFMKAERKEVVTEVKCSACNGKGFPKIERPKPGRKIYPALCKECGGKGRVAQSAA